MFGKYVFIIDLRLNLMSDESGNINFVDNRESIQFLIVFLELEDCPRTNLFEKNILLDSLVVVCFESNFLLS
jgi:hypothetical protein